MFFHSEDGDALEQVAQKGCGCLPSLKALKARLYGALSKLVQREVSLHTAGVWNSMILNVSSNPNHPNILSFYIHKSCQTDHCQTHYYPFLNFPEVSCISANFICQFAFSFVLQLLFQLKIFSYFQMAQVVRQKNVALHK